MSEPLISNKLEQYLNKLVPRRHKEMERMEQIARERGFPIIGPAAGHACYQLARQIQATRIFELGSGYGYSTAWFAQAVKENGGGIVHHVVWDEELSAQAQRHMKALDLDSIVQFTVSEALAALRAALGPFDLIFNDIQKEAYPASVALAEEKLRPGGLFVVDNALWSGRIFDDADHSKATEGVRKLTELLTQSSGWITTLLPMRDGLLVALKR